MRGRGNTKKLKDPTQKLSESSRLILKAARMGANLSQPKILKNSMAVLIGKLVVKDQAKTIWTQTQEEIGQIASTQ